MANKNTNLQAAKNTKYDEFYTTYETIEKEISHYSRCFENKTVLCNCDDPYESNFCLYFLKNFNKLKIQRLICTSYYLSKIIPNSKKGAAFVLDTRKFSDVEGLIDEEIIKKLLKKPGVIKKLKGDGDFRSEECVKYLYECDIVVTNPPFSLFNDFVMLVVNLHKHFLVIGNQNALTYKDIFPLIQKNIVWTGYQFGEMKFRVPADSEPRKTRFWIDSKGQKWRSLGNAMWLTNLNVDRHNKLLSVVKKYNPNDYPKYDLYDAIDVKTIRDIPYDYNGVMGVPITIINWYNSQQFEIIGEANHGSDSEFDLFEPTIQGKRKFKRILIKNKRLVNERV